MAMHNACPEARSLKVTAGSRFVYGRTSLSSVVGSLDPRISRKHLQVECAVDGSLTIMRLGANVVLLQEDGIYEDLPQGKATAISVDTIVWLLRDQQSGDPVYPVKIEAELPSRVEGHRAHETATAPSTAWPDSRDGEEEAGAIVRHAKPVQESGHAGPWPVAAPGAVWQVRRNGKFVPFETEETQRALEEAWARGEASVEVSGGTETLVIELRSPSAEPSSSVIWCMRQRSARGSGGWRPVRRIGPEAIGAAAPELHSVDEVASELTTEKKRSNYDITEGGRRARGEVDCHEVDGGDVRVKGARESELVASHTVQELGAEGRDASGSEVSDAQGLCNLGREVRASPPRAIGASNSTCCGDSSSGGGGASVPPNADGSEEVLLGHDSCGASGVEAACTAVEAPMAVVIGSAHDNGDGSVNGGGFCSDGDDDGVDDDEEMQLALALSLSEASAASASLPTQMLPPSPARLAAADPLNTLAVERYACTSGANAFAESATTAAASHARFERAPSTVHIDEDSAAPSLQPARHASPSRPCAAFRSTESVNGESRGNAAAPVVIDLMDSDDDVRGEGETATVCQLAGLEGRNRPFERREGSSEGHGVSSQPASLHPASTQLAEVRRARAAAFAAAKRAKCGATSPGGGAPVSAAPAASYASSTDAAPIEHACPLHLLSYNLWFQPVEVEKRMEAVARIADGTAPRPALFAMQECTAQLMAPLIPRLLTAGYVSPVVQPFGNGAGAYGVALTTRPPLGPPEHARFVSYRESDMQRGVLLARVRWPGAGHVMIGCTHAESFVGVENEHVVVPRRRRQLAEATALLAAEAQRHGCVAALLMGDLNWNDKDGELMNSVGDGWRDAWVEMGCAAATRSTCGWPTSNWRYDRLLLWRAAAPTGGAAQSRVVASSLMLVGRKPIPGLRYTAPSGRSRSLAPSDHRGLLVTLEYKAAGS